MESSFKNKRLTLVSLRKRQKRRNRAVAALGVLVVLATAIALMMPAITMTHGDLVCGMEEHQHSDACYEKVLVCGQEEGDNHHHSDACYEKQLVCDTTPHTHANECYADLKSEPEPAADGDSSPDASASAALEAKADKPADSETVSDGAAEASDVGDGETSSDVGTDTNAEANARANTDADTKAAVAIEAITGTVESQGIATDSDSDHPAQIFLAELVDSDANPVLAIFADAPEGALPSGASMRVDGVDAASLADQMEAAVSYDKKLAGKAEVGRALAVDIVFSDGDGNEIEPNKPVKVKLGTVYVQEFANPELVHVLDAEKAQKAGKLNAEGNPMEAEVLSKVAIVNWDENDMSEGSENTMSFKADDFGTYAIAELQAIDEKASGEASESGEGDNVDAADDDEDAENEVVVDGEASNAEKDCPAQQFSQKLKDDDGNVTLAVDVDAPEGALPEGTTMKLKPITKESTLEAAKDAAVAAADIDASYAKALAVDIAFYDANGEAVEPQIDVHVTMNAPAVAQAAKKAASKANKPAEVAVVHVPDGEAAEVVKTIDADPSAGIVEFDSANFSVYALAYGVISSEVISASGETYTISVYYDEEAGIPDDAELKVREIAVGTDEYNHYLEGSATALGKTTDNIVFARFFDIEIVKGNHKIEPTTSVQVKIAYKDAIDEKSDQSLSVVHFADEGTEVISDIRLNEDSTEITYLQDSFSVTATIWSAGGNPSGGGDNGQDYVVIVKQGNDYYSVLSDGSLKLLDANSYDPLTNTIDVDYPLLWEYKSVYSPNDYAPYTLRIESVASGFLPNNLPSGYYYRYINPNVSSGISEEDANHPDLTDPNVDNCRLFYNAATHQLYGMQSWEQGSNGNYIGVQNGRLVGLQDADHAAEIYFATVAVPNTGNNTHNDHMVNHIDIAIAGGSQIKMPLAYGEYYDAAGNVIYRATAEDHILEMVPDIEITTDDMKHASITATAMVNGERVEVPDAFYITGYSQNHETGQELAQVRVEGSFKVSNIPYAENADNIQAVRQARKDNPIDYTVSVVKTVPINVTIGEGDDKQQLYYKNENDELVPLVFDVPITLSASFNYWQTTNNCPPLHINYDETLDFVQDWKDGKIVGNGYDMSGMDFKLGTGHTGDLSVPAIEINKAIQKIDDDGSISYLKTTTTHDVDVSVYYKSKGEGEENQLVNVGVNAPVDEEVLETLTEDYSRLHDKVITVGEDAIGAIYDYDVNPGLLYVEEDQSSIDTYVTGTDGNLYQYVSTRMETEYAWRASGDDNKVHNADGTTSVPEVLGEYISSEWWSASKTFASTELANDFIASIRDNPHYRNVSGPVWDQESNGYKVTYETEQADNGFLEYYIFNVYKKVETVDVPVDKSWGDDIDNDSSYEWSATFELEECEVYDADLSGENPPTSEANTNEWRKVTGIDPITITSGAGEQPKFEDLPKYRYYPNGSVYRIMYSVDEVAYELKQNGETISKWDKVNGLTVGSDVFRPQFIHDAGDSGDESGIGENDPDYYHVKLINHKEDVTVTEVLINLTIQKRWKEGSLEQAGVAEKDAYATFQLKREVTKEYREYDASALSNVQRTVTLYDQNNNPISTLTVRNGAKISVAATFSSAGQIEYSIGGTGQSVAINGDSGSTETSSRFTVTEDMEIRPTGNWTATVSEAHLTASAGAWSPPEEDTDYSNERHTYTVSRSVGWQQTMHNLPLTEEGKIVEGQQTIYHYRYYFVEIKSNPGGFAAEFTDGNGNPIGDSSHPVSEDNVTAIAYNTPAYSIEIIKINETTRPDETPTTYLSGAEFALYRYSGQNYTVYPDQSGGVKTTDENGKLLFTNLSDGEYKIEETAVPAGYVSYSGDGVYFNVTDGVVTRYSEPYNGTSRESDTPIAADAEVNQVTYQLNQDSGAFVTFTVGNTPGEPLPNTGGSGTTPFTTLGATLVAVGIAGILIRRKGGAKR